MDRAFDQMEGVALESMQRYLASGRDMAAAAKNPRVTVGLLLGILDSDFVRLLKQYRTEYHLVPPCSRGCWWCCTIPVIVAPLEALHIVVWMKRRGLFTTSLSKRLRAVSERRWDDHRTKCAFLRHRDCIIYPVRPVTCRGHYGMVANQCQADYRFGHEIVGDIGTLGTPAMLAQGMMAAIMAMVEERKVVLLEDAILAVRDAGGPEKAWAKLRVGQEVFARPWAAPTLKEYVSEVTMLRG